MKYGAIAFYARLRTRFQQSAGIPARCSCPVPNPNLRENGKSLAKIRASRALFG
jgi:hypothetical protein